MAADNTAWQLEDFVDSLVVDLDKTRETLAVKAINKPLTYTVKELSLDLNIFPTYDGDSVRFTTAQPGQQGASKVSIQLGSITDQQVRATTKVPEASGVSIDDINIDKGTKKQLRKLGVQSVDDLQRVEKKNVDLKRVVNNDIDYRSLANQIQNPALLRRQPSQRIGVRGLGSHPLHHPGRGLLIEQRSAGRNRTHRSDQVKRTDLLEHVTGRPRHDRVEQRLVVPERGKHQAADLGQLRPDFAAHRDAVPIGEPHVKDRDIRSQGGNPGQRRLGSTGLADHRDVRLGLKQVAYPTPHDLVVIKQEHFDRGCLR